MPAQALRLIRDEDVVCPAGRAAGDVGCRCAIEGSLIDGRTSPDSLERFCCGDYTVCPTWRADKERVWARQREALLDTGLPG